MKSYLVVKPILDFIFASLLLVLLAPVFVIAALIIKIDSPGPVFFRQERPGKDGKIFTVYKFRTMSVETEQDGRPLSDLERITGVGKILRKTSIDELPQLFNIFLGEMSFFGPRPLLVEYLIYYTPEQMRRHQVKPGVSGLAQVKGRNSISWEEKFQLDLWYVDHISFSLDCKIFLLTLIKILSRTGVNQSQNETMEEFKGTGDLNGSKRCCGEHSFFKCGTTGRTDSTLSFRKREIKDRWQYPGG